jgi:hypothetical protein
MSQNGSRGPQRLTRGLAFVALGLGAAMMSCGGSTGSVVFGVTSELDAGSQLTSLSATVTLDGETILEREFTSDLAFPMELQTGDVSADGRVTLLLEARRGSETLLVARAETTVLEGQSLLVRVPLETDCVGELCGESTTCVEGQCVSSERDPAELPEYSEGWAGGASVDRCEPDPGGEPEVILGEGQSNFLPVEPGQVLQVEAGPQGGYHVWVASRIRNLKQGGSITEVSGSFVDLDYSPPPLAIVFSFDPDEGGFCKIFGLRFRLDDPEHPIETLLGRELDLTVTITDSDGDVGTDTQRVRLSDSFI